MFTARARRLLRCTGSRHSAGQGKAWQQGVGRARQRRNYNNISPALPRRLRSPSSLPRYCGQHSAASLCQLPRC